MTSFEVVLDVVITHACNKYFMQGGWKGYIKHQKLAITNE